MQLFDVFTKKVFEKDGENKIIYYKAGAMKITDKGTIYIRLFHIPEVDFFVREREPVIPVVDTEK
jgi:hypothetical protein